eukprot:EC849099.1.p2 GENE.EC849099.1~~EC849099.1.p2  ORF type:complete len:72 (-),score=19.65 EC849099.1:127-342(-)
MIETLIRGILNTSVEERFPSLIKKKITMTPTTSCNAVSAKIDEARPYQPGAQTSSSSVESSQSNHVKIMAE